jgi:hypothetical protein
VRAVGTVVGDRFGTISYGISVPGRDSLPSAAALGGVVSMTLADPAYLPALGLPLLAGRTFEAADDRPGRQVVVVSKRIAEAYWPGSSPIGACVRLGDDDPTRPCREVIGVVGDRRDVFDTAGVAELFAPLHSGAKPEGQPIVWDTRGLLVRTSGGATAAQARQIDRLVHEALPALPRIGTQTLEAFYDPFQRSWRLGAVLLSALAGLAIVLALVGAYAVMASVVAERRRELGIRIALGASRTHLAAWLARRVLWTAPVAVLVGLVIARAGARSAESLLFRTSAADAGAYAAAGVLVLAAVVVAAAIPLARAGRIAPDEVLRAE